MFEQATIQERAYAEHFNPEARRFDDLTTWLAEALDGQMRTPFTYRFDGSELYGQDGSALGIVFRKAVTTVQQDVIDRPELAFELRRRRHELDEYYEMLAVAAGELPNTMVVVSDFPDEAKQSQAEGYDPDRRQAMLRIIQRQDDGTVDMLSQSLDGSNRLALEGFYDALGFRVKRGELLGQRMIFDMPAGSANQLIDQLTRRYDHAMQEQFGGQWYAGRRSLNHINTYDFVLNQQDLLQALLRKPTYDRQELYNLAAAMQARYERGAQPDAQVVLTEYVYSRGDVQNEMQLAGQLARVQGKRFNGCGATVDSQGESSTEGELAEAGYGNQSGGEEEKPPKTMRCINCRKHVSSKDVVKPKSWCCPECAYEVDICTGKILNKGSKQKQGKIGVWTLATLFTKS